MSSIHTSKVDRSASVVFGLVLTAVVIAFVLAGAHQLADIIAQVNVAMGGAR